MTSLLAPLADGALAGATLSDCVLVASATVALAAQGLPPVFLCFAVARARGASTNIHGIGVGGVLLKQGGLV